MGEAKVSRLFRRIGSAALPLAVVVLALSVAGWFIASRPRALPAAPAEKLWAVAVVDVRAEDIQPDVRVFGEVRAGREAELRAMVAGRLVSISPEFRDGAVLESGQLLATIDPVDYENQLTEQRAELTRIDAQLREFQVELEWERRLASNAARQVELARRALERSSELARSGRESQKSRDDAELALAASEQAQLLRDQAVARLQLRIAQQHALHTKAQTSVSAAERELARTRIVAPFAGYVTEVGPALGQVLGIGEKLGRLLSRDELEVRFELPERDFARLLDATGDAELLGRPVSVVWQVGESRRVFTASVSRMGAEIDSTLGGIELYATLAPTAARYGLRSGAFVEVQLPDVEYRGVFRIPERAVSDGSVVYQLVDARLREVPVTRVRDLGEEILVRGDIDDKFPLVARAFAGIGPGLRARPL